MPSRTTRVTRFSTAAAIAPFHSVWYGGKQSVLCPRLALGHVKKNYSWLLDHGIKMRGAYLDVFAVVPPDECYNPEHPATRTDCLNYRGMCLDFIRSQGGVVSSEEPADWAIPHLDLVHHGPHALDAGPRQRSGHGCSHPPVQPGLSRRPAAALVAGTRQVGGSRRKTLATCMAWPAPGCPICPSRPVTRSWSRCAPSARCTSAWAWRR